MSDSLSPTNSPSQSRPVQFRLRTLLIVVTVFCIIAGWLVGFLYRGVSTSRDAEMTLQAHIWTLDALTKFVQGTGRWPKSWDELNADAGQRRGLVGSPGDTKDLQSRVTVNFQLELKDIATMTPEAFSAVTESKPNYGPNDDWVRGLLDAVRKARPASKSR